MFLQHNNIHVYKVSLSTPHMYKAIAHNVGTRVYAHNDAVGII